MTKTTIETRNPGLGFHGTIAHNTAPAEAWGLAMAAIGRATGAGAEAVREFLDSRHGRHFADDVANSLAGGLATDAAIEAVVTRWMGWRIDRRTAQETGIPKGLPYLTGFVTHFGILADLPW